ncbi:MAG TPA: SDR family oxidoreductase [Frankiaceae bacterium]|jgi:NAD(P)-dependent dehydrogenase (short-subunit alcohol dehydrogenase family)|nr:SDR family oxidoreductase [Frankiaceae bacterium]
MARSLEGQRVLVVGASSGIGREFALQAVRDGAKVLLAARRQDRLEALAVEADGGLPVVVDITDADSCAALAETVRSEVGEVDLVVCSAGYSPLRHFVDASPQDWQRVLGINVIGIHQMVRAVLPVTKEGGLIAVMSSESTSQPRHALGVYTSSKAALEMSIRVWRQEQPRARFTTLVVGGTFPTDFGADFDMDILMPAMEDWARIGTIQERLMDTAEVASVIRGSLTSIVDLPDISLDQIVIRSPSPVIGGAEQLKAEAEENIGKLQDSQAGESTTG